MAGQKRYFFLNENIGKGLTGVESSAFLRAKLFKEYLGIIPTFVTFCYNNDLRINQQKFIDAGVLDADVPVLNMFDFYCDKVEMADKDNDQSLTRQSGATYELPNNDLDYRILRNNQLSMYVKYHSHKRLVHFINYFDDNKKIFKRDYFDVQGYLSSSTIIDVPTGRNMIESYVDRTGRERILIHNDVVGDEIKIHRIMLKNSQGMVTDIFNSMMEMVAEFIKRMSRQYHNDELFYIVDRNKQYYPALRQLEHPNIHTIPIIHSMHTTTTDVMKSSLNSNFTAVLADMSDARVTPVVFTKEQKKDIEARFGQADGVAVIPHSSHYDKPFIPFAKRDPMLVTAISRYSDEKQVDKMIDAFAIVHKAVPKARLDIYGYGGQQKALQEQIDKLELTTVVKLKGIIDNPYVAFEKASLSLLTSRCEAFALVVMESLMTGCPVASFDIKYGPSSMIDDGKDGCLSPLNDVQAMADKVIKVLNDPKQHEKMCKNAYEKGKTLHAKAVSKKWQALLSHASF